MNTRYSTIKLGEVVKQVRVPVGTFDGDGLPVLGVTNTSGIATTSNTASEDKSHYLRLHSFMFAYNPYRINVGSIGLSVEGQEGIVSPAYVVFVVTEQIDPTYLLRYLKSREGNKQINFYGNRGTVRSALRFEDFCKIEIPFPSIEEQQRIVARIEELAAKIEGARGLRQLSVENVGSLEVSAAREEFANLNERNILPLRELVTISGGGTPSKLDPTFWLGTIPWISPKDMKIREIRDSIDHISEEAIGSSSAKLIDPGAVLIVTRGMILAHTVPSAVLRVQATINQDMKALVPSKHLLPEYLCNALWALNEELLKLVEKSTHDTRKLETPKLLEFKIPVPSLSEQQRIIAYLDNLQYKVNCLKQLQAETSAELDALLPSILDKAFKGEL